MTTTSTTAIHLPVWRSTARITSGASGRVASNTNAQTATKVHDSHSRSFGGALIISFDVGKGGVGLGAGDWRSHYPRGDATYCEVLGEVLVNVWSDGTGSAEVCHQASRT